MDGDDAGRQLAAASASPHVEEAIAAVRDDAYARHCTPSDDEDCDDLYGDVNVGFLPLLPLSPSPSPTSPPKTPSPGCSIPSPTPSPSPPPHRAPAPEPLPQREPEPRPKPANPRHQPPPPPPAPPRHHAPPQPQRAPRGSGASYSLPPGRTALYISELHWWTTDAEVEAALELAPRGAAAALRGLHFYGDKHTGKSRGICRADFLDTAAAASAAATLHGRAFHGRHCVASLARPPALHRLGDDPDSCAEAARTPNHTRGIGNGGRGASNAATVRGNVGPALGDRPILAPPPLPMVPQPCRGPPFGGMMGGVGGFGGFQSMGQYNAAVGTGMVPSAVAPHVNPSFFAAGGMAMRGPGVWPDQGMTGGLWGAQQGWNFSGCQMPWQQLAAPSQNQQAQQQYGNRDYEKERGRKQERPDGRNEERGIGNDGYPNRMQSDRDGGDWYKEHDHEKKSRHREHVLEKEREQERQWNERGRHGGGKRRHQEYTERSDFDRKARARSRSQSRDDGGDDHPRRRR